MESRAKSGNPYHDDKGRFTFSFGKNITSKKYDIHINGNHKSLNINKHDREILYHHLNSVYHNLNPKNISHGVIYGDHLWMFDSVEQGAYLIWGRINININRDIIKIAKEEYDVYEYPGNRTY